jgi:hypothetical protein
VDSRPDEISGSEPPRRSQYLLSLLQESAIPLAANLEANFFLLQKRSSKRRVQKYLATDPTLEVDVPPQASTGGFGSTIQEKSRVCPAVFSLDKSPFAF